MDSAGLRDEEGKTVIHCAAEQGKSHKHFICAFSSRRKLDLYYWLCLGYFTLVDMCTDTDIWIVKVLENWLETHCLPMSVNSKT